MNRAKRIMSFAMCASILLSSVISYCFAAGSVPKAVIAASKSVFRVISEYDDGYGLGSGFIISKKNGDTYIATNYHVVEDSPIDIAVIDGDGKEIKATIAASDPKEDLAILRIKNNTLGQSLNVNFSELSRGDAIFAVGFPGAADYIAYVPAYSSDDATITNGIVSSIRQGTTLENAGVTFIQMTAPINHGNSGGPLFDAKGRVVGINTYVAEDAQGIYWSISIEQIQPLAQQLGIQLTEVQSNLSYLLIIGCVAIIIIGAALLLKSKKKARPSEPRVDLHNPAEIKCTVCGERHPIGSKFCKKCGAPLQNSASISIERSQAKTLYCKKCGSRVVPGTKFCNRCGSPLQ